MPSRRQLHRSSSRYRSFGQHWSWFSLFNMGLLMSAIASIILAAAVRVGAPIIGNVIKGTIGGTGGDIAESVIKSIADRMDLEPADIANASAESIENAVRQVELDAAELLPIWLKGVEGQFALLQSEAKEGLLQSGWRWGWMYLLALLWIWRIVVLPIVNAGFGSQIEAIDLAVLLTLTSWFIGLYMGGHTVKELGKNIIDAVKTWKSPA